MDRLRAALFDHRRPLAAACAALAVLAGLQSLQPHDTGAPVLVAARDLASGHVLAGSDLTTTTMPAAARPSHLLTARSATGRRIAGPVRAGEPLTDRRVIEPRDLSGYGADAVLTMVRLDDSGVLAGLRVGDRVDVVAAAADSEVAAQVVASGAVIAVVPETDDRSGDTATVGVITGRSAALELASAALDARLSVLVSS